MGNRGQVCNGGIRYVSRQQKSNIYSDIRNTLPEARNFFCNMKLLLLLPLVWALVCAHPMDGPADSSAVEEFVSMRASIVPTKLTEPTKPTKPTEPTKPTKPMMPPKTKIPTIPIVPTTAPTILPTNVTTIVPTNVTTIVPTNVTTIVPTTVPSTVPSTPAPPVTQVTCGGTISTTSTNSFVSPSYPNRDSNVLSPCRVRVDITGNDVCQLRLDFESFSLSQPSAETSQCDTDVFRIFETGNDAFVPEICGENVGQHLYVEVDASSRGPILEVDTYNPGVIDRFSRLWNIQVTQIQCGSVHRAPEGCQQYYNTSSGTVKSFNFKEPPSSAAQIGTGTNLQLHLANQNYQVCIMEQPGMCSIRWTPTTTSTFVMTGSYIGAGAAIGTGNAWVDAYTGAQAGDAPPNPTAPCADYVIIVECSYAAIDSVPAIPAGQSDRYCGGTFSTVTSTAQPFGLRVKTDGTEPFATESVNVGFSLDYRMLATGC